MMRATLLVTALLALGAVAGCGGDDKKRGAGTSGSPATTPKTTTSSASRTGTKYPAAVEANFMRACTRTSKGKATICQCAFDKIEATISYDELKRQDAAIAAGARPSRKFTNAMAGCR
jgi:ABC-type glycerol-3-phosphate transport system substrate-binding protein